MKLDPKDYPTPTELAQIAASLAAGKRSAQYSDAAKSALELWKACAAELEYAQLIESDLTQQALNNDLDEVIRYIQRCEELDQLLDKDSYTLDELLKLAFPKARTEPIRTGRFRDFLNDHLRGLRATEMNVPLKDAPTVSLDDRNNYLKKLRDDGLTRDECKILILRLDRRKKLKSKERATKAGKASGKKRKK
jgi:hypothetical protein